MRQSPARHHHNKQRAEGFVPNQNGQDNNNDNGNSPGNNNNNGNNGSSSSAAATTTTTQASSASVSRTVAATTTTTTTPPAPTTTTTTTTTPASSSSTTTTSSAAIVTTTTTTPLNVVPTTASVINQIPTTASVPIVHSAANPTIGTASLSSDSASATASAQASSGPQIGPMVGAIGGGLIGVVVLAAIAGYFFRRAFRKKDEFNRSDFVRNSVAINDNWDEKPPTQNAMALARGNMDQPSATPRPPSMVERRGQAQPAYGVGEVVNNGYYGQQDQYYNNYGNNGYYGQDQYGAAYDQQYAAGGHPYVAGAAYGYTPPNEYQQSQLTRKPSAPLGAARGPGSEYEQQQQQQQQGHEHVASPAEGSQYDGRHQSVTPFQQQQYNEISKALNGGLTPVNETPAGGRELSTAYSTLNQPQQPAQGQQQHGTPAAANAHQAANNRRSLYDEDDAYGGI